MMTLEDFLVLSLANEVKDDGDDATGDNIGDDGDSVMEDGMRRR